MNYQQELEKACGEELMLINSFDSDRKEIYHLAVTMDGMTVLEITPLKGNLKWCLEQSVNNQSDKIVAARRAKDTLQAMNRAQAQMKQFSDQAGKFAQAMKTAQESML